jgi:hypothetical protein
MSSNEQNENRIESPQEKHRNVEVEKIRNEKYNDGHLYVYREDDTYIIVVSNNESSKSSIKEVPAERETIEAGEELYAIPGNWEPLIVSKRDAGGPAVYHLPEMDREVLLEAPKNDSIENISYQVESVGRLTLEYADKCDWERLEERIQELKNDDTANSSTLNGLQDVYDQRYKCEADLIRQLEDDGLNKLLGTSDEPTEVGRKIVEPYSKLLGMPSILRFETALQDPAIDSSVLYSRVQAELIDENIVPDPPKMRIDVSPPQHK